LVMLPVQEDPGALVRALWRSQHKGMWAKVKQETGSGKDRWSIAKLFADERCSEALLEFLRTTDVGRMVPGEAAVRRRRSPAQQGSAVCVGCADRLDDFFSFSSLFLFHSLVGSASDRPAAGFHLGRPGRAGMECVSSQ